MANCAIVGINWGDEGKGRMVDLITQSYDVVIRYQGGGNAGHTVVNDKGKFALHLLPSGIFREGVVNVLGNGVALDCESLWREMEDVRGKGVPVTPENLKISERASLLLPWHRELDALEEARLKDKKYGSTKQGIAPFYSDKFQKKTVLAGELRYPDYLKAHLSDLLEWKNLILRNVYGAPGYTMEQLWNWIEDYGEKIKPFLCDAAAFLRGAEAAGKNLLFEAQLGSLRDLDYGIYPYTTSSNAVASYAPVGSGLPSVKIDEVIGVVKAYSTCVGEGPFTCEWFGEAAERLRQAGAEYGAKTGRPRRVGPIDLVATRYGADCPDQTGCSQLSGGNPPLRPLCGRRRTDGRVPASGGASGRETRDGDNARLETRYFRCTQVGRPAGSGAEIRGICGKRHRLPHPLCLRGTGAGRGDSPITVRRFSRLSMPDPLWPIVHVRLSMKVSIVLCQ